jgi:hypothetical protein
MDFFELKPKVDKKILEQVKKKKQIIYGAQSIKKQIGEGLSRSTSDFDIFAHNPKKAATETEREIEKLTPTDTFFVKPAVHKGTFKIKYKGQDMKPNTKDDKEIADYTKTPSPLPPTKTLNGIRYRTLAQEKKAKRMSLRDKQFKFRHEKDREDLNRAENSKVIFDLFE